MPFLDRDYLLKVIRGQERGLQPAFLRVVLRLASWGYAIGIRWINWRFELLPSLSKKAKLPVISVGNLTTGGTGKTPFVAWLCTWWRQRHVRVAIISRGYGAAEGAVNDEALELELRLPDVPHLQNPDRAAMAELAFDELDSQLIILDDGFQHRKLQRDLEIVLLDAICPFGYGYLLPRGLLREPVSSLRRADAVIVSRADLIDQAELGRLEARIKQLAPQAVLGIARHSPSRIVSASGTSESLDQLNGAAVLAFCGIGNAEGFFELIRKCGATILDQRVFTDHYNYARADLQALSGWGAESRETKPVYMLCTQKDLVKIQLDELGNLPLRALQVEWEFVSNQQGVETLLNQINERIGHGANPQVSD